MENQKKERNERKTQLNKIKTKSKIKRTRTKVDRKKTINVYKKTENKGKKSRVHLGSGQSWAMKGMGRGLSCVFVTSGNTLGSTSKKWTRMKSRSI